MKKLKAKLIYGIFFLLIAGIVVFPLVYFQVMDERKYNGRQPMREITYSLDSDVEDVAMVQRIHARKYRAPPGHTEPDRSRHAKRQRYHLEC